MAGSSRNSDLKHDDRLFHEKVNRLYSNQKLGHLATLVNALILAAVQWHKVNHHLLYAWFALAVTATLARIFLSWQFNRQASSSSRAGLWARLFLIGILFSGMTWGLAGILIFPRSSFVHQMFTAFTIGGMVAGAAAVYAALRSAFFAFSLPAMVPVIINALSFHDSVHFAMAVMMTLFLIIMVFTSFRNRQVIEDSIRLSFEKQGLLDYLTEAKHRTEAVNRKLQDEIEQRLQIEAELEMHERQLESEVKNRTSELQESNDQLRFEINERTRMETALRESEERYRRLIENAIVGIIVIRDQKLVFANSFVSNLSGYTAEETLGMPIIDFIHPDDRELVASNYDRRMKGESAPESYALRMLNRKGETFWVEVSAVRLTYEGRPAVLVFMRDISQQRQLESQLFQSEKMASIGQLAAGVAHEINNPVGFVSSNLHTLSEYQKDTTGLIVNYRSFLLDARKLWTDAMDARMSDQLSEIERIEDEMDLDFIMEDGPHLIAESRQGLDRIKKIVTDLKDFAHPGSQTRQTIDVNKCIDSTLNIVWNELKYNTNVIKDFDQLPGIEGYPQQLNQVFMNLLVNAAQSIAEKGEIRIRTRSAMDHVEIEISDTGCGIPPENLTKIFDPFFTTKPVGKGTGLGLNVSYNIISKHDGTINAASTVGKGTTFTIRLPIQAHCVSEKISAGC